MLTKLNNLYNQIKEEVSTYLDSENKLKNSETSDTSSETSNTETSNVTSNVETECCDVAAGMDVGSVMRTWNCRNFFS